MDIATEVSNLVSLFEENSSISLLDLISKTLETLKDDDFAVAGGMAFSLYAEPRATQDFDLVIVSSDLEKIKEKLKTNGFQEKDFYDFGKGKTKLDLHKFTLKNRELDIMVFPEISDWLLKSSKQKKLAGHEIKVISPEALVVIKLSSGRPKDFADIFALKDKIDWDTVKIKASDFGIYGDLADYLDYESKALERMKTKHETEKKESRSRLDKKLLDLFEEVTGSALNEYVGDNKVDNLAEELKRATEIELNMFAASLINSSVNSFLQSYATPQFEGFKTTISAIVERFRVMDDAERLDLFQKIEIMFKDLMTKNFAALGPETAELIASRYSKQMLQFFKDKNTDPQSATDTLYPHRRDINAKAEPVADTEPWQAKVQAKMQVADLTNDDQVDVLIANPY